MNFKLLVIFSTLILSGCSLFNLAESVALIPVAITDGVIGTHMAKSIDGGIQETLRPGNKMEKQSIQTELLGKTIYTIDSIVFFDERGESISKRNSRMYKDKWVVNNGEVCISNSCYEMRKKDSTILYGSNDERISVKAGDAENLREKFENQTKADSEIAERTKRLAMEAEIKKNEELRLTEIKRNKEEKSKDEELQKKNTKALLDKEIALKKALKLLDKKVSWLGHKQIDTEDCVKLFLFKKCAWVTYHFNLKGTVSNVDKVNETFTINVSDAKLVSKGMVSIAYIKYRKMALEWEKDIVGNTMAVAFKDVL